MAKRESKHPAPLAVTQSDRNMGLARIINLSAKFQSPSVWMQLLKAAKEFRSCLKKYSESTNLIFWERKRQSLLSLKRERSLSYDESQELENLPKWCDESFEELEVDVRRYRSMTKDLCEKVKGSLQELVELKDIVRRHTPQLLELFPDVNLEVCCENSKDFLFVSPEVDHSQLRRNFRKLEGEARVLSQGGRSVKPHSEDQRRLKFYDARKAENGRLTHNQIAALWCEANNDHCDEGAFKQSVYRARKANR